MLSKNIKKQRLKLGYTLQQVGDVIGVTRSTVQKYESGDIENIDTNTIIKLANALDTTPSQLCGWEKIPLTNRQQLDELLDICIKLDDAELKKVIDMIKIMF